MPAYTFLQIQTRVSDEVNDSSNGSVSLAQVKKAIVSAVEHYERQRTWYGETFTRNTVTVAGFPAVAAPTDLVFMDKMQLASTTTITGTTSIGAATITGCSSTAFSVGQFITGTGIPANTLIKSIDSSTQITMGDVFGASVTATANGSITIRVASPTIYTVQPISYNQYLEYQGAAVSPGQPGQYCYHQDRFFLYPVPTQVYSLRLIYVARLTTLSADADTNGWTNFAEPVIRNRAKWDIFANLLYMPKLAASCKAQEMDAFEELDTEMEQRNTTGRLRPKYL